MTKVSWEIHYIFERIKLVFNDKDCIFGTINEDINVIKT